MKCQYFCKADGQRGPSNDRYTARHPPNFKAYEVTKSLFCVEIGAPCASESRADLGETQRNEEA